MQVWTSVNWMIALFVLMNRRMDWEKPSTGLCFLSAFYRIVPLTSLHSGIYDNRCNFCCEIHLACCK